MRYLQGEPHQLPGHRSSLSGHAARHFQFAVDGGVATLTLDRPERKNPLTFDSYAELRDLFRALAQADDVKALVLSGAGGNFCSGGDVHEIIGPLTRLDMPGLLAFTRLTGDVVKAMRACPQPIVAAIDGVCAPAPTQCWHWDRICASAPRAARPPSCSPALAWLAATWAHARCCRA
jgi:1,4-dihydroxy-2-naphthoyl-CoA synthase